MTRGLLHNRSADGRLPLLPLGPPRRAAVPVAAAGDVRAAARAAAAPGDRDGGAADLDVAGRRPATAHAARVPHVRRRLPRQPHARLPAAARSTRRRRSCSCCRPPSTRAGRSPGPRSRSAPTGIPTCSARWTGRMVEEMAEHGDRVRQPHARAPLAACARRRGAARRSCSTRAGRSPSASAAATRSPTRSATGTSASPPRRPTRATVGVHDAVRGPAHRHGRWSIPRVAVDQRDDERRFALKLTPAGRRLLLSPAKERLRAGRALAPKLLLSRAR